jgi:hypothetical protein
MPEQPITRRKGAGVNVQAKSLTTYLSGMRFCNYPQLLLIFPERQTQVEMMGEKTTQASHRALLFEEVLILKPHAENTDQQVVEYTLIAFTVFSESHGRGHYKAYCKKGDKGGWYLFDDEKITKKHGDIAKITSKGIIGTQVTSLYYLKNEEAMMKKSAEKAHENLDQEIDHGCDDVGREESDVGTEKGGEETTTQENLDQEVYHGYDVPEEEERPYEPTTAPIESSTASGTSNGVYISSPIQHNNIIRSHQLFFTATYDELLCDNDEVNAHHDDGTSNGVYISSPIQHNNILRSHQLFFTATYEDNADDSPSLHESLKILSNSPMPPNCVEQMIYPPSGFAFVTRQLSEF